MSWDRRYKLQNHYCIDALESHETGKENVYLVKGQEKGRLNSDGAGR